MFEENSSQFHDYILVHSDSIVISGVLAAKIQYE